MAPEPEAQPERNDEYWHEFLNTGTTSHGNHRDGGLPDPSGG